MNTVDGRVEIRLLGNLKVRRADGSVVDPAEWKTGKTRDLLRLLALRAGEPVRIESILDKLWPDVDSDHGRASLRTAASRIRSALRSDCIERRFGGLVLVGAWTDVGEARELAAQFRACLARGEHARVVGLARSAEALYVQDFEADDNDSDWAVSARHEITSLRREVLTGAAESALKVAYLDDAIDLAKRAIAADPSRERPQRCLMQALAAVGETDQALRVFDQYRAMLAEELGADPSPQTRAVHLQILCGEAPWVVDASTLDRPEPEVVRIGARRGWGSSFEQQVMLWLDDQAPGESVKLKVSVVGKPGQVMVLDVQPSPVNDHAGPSARTDFRSA